MKPLSLRSALLTFVALFMSSAGAESPRPSEAPMVYSSVAESSKVSFALPFTFGTHEGTSSALGGELRLDASKRKLLAGRFSLPISSIKTGNRKLECHLQESLGLDYSVSEFPGSHVCDGDENLPKEGKNSVKFPLIELELKASDLVEGQTEVEGVWSIHGVKKSQRFAVSWTQEGKDLRVRAKLPAVLDDYGIVVKKFLIVKVDPVAQVSVDLLLRAN